MLAYIISFTIIGLCFKIMYKEIYTKKNSNHSNDLIDKLNKEDIEFKENIKSLVEKEIESNRFKIISEFINNYENRSNLDLERKLFKIVGNYGFDDNLINKNYKEVKEYRISKFEEINKFVNSLTKEQIDSNIYLKLVKLSITNSISDSDKIIEKLLNNINTIGLSNINKKIDVCTDVLESRKELLINQIDEQLHLSYQGVINEYLDYADILGMENINTYIKYNDFVKKVNNLAMSIYKYRMWDLLKNYPIQVNNCDLYISKNTSKPQFRASFIVKKDNTINIKELEELRKNILSNKLSGIDQYAYQEYTDDLIDYKELSKKVI